MYQPVETTVLVLQERLASTEATITELRARIGVLEEEKAAGQEELKTLKQNNETSSNPSSNPTQIFFDLETTSLQRSCGITQIAAMTLSGDKFFNQYVIPDQNIDPKASEITGLTLVRGKLYLHEKLVEKAATQVDALADFLSFIEGFAQPILIAHNCTSFDSKVLVNALVRGGLFDRFADILVNGGFADSLPLFRRAFPQSQKHALGYLASNVLNREFKAHDALEDVKVLRDLAMRPESQSKSFEVFGAEDVLEAIDNVSLINEFVDKCGLSEYMAKKLVEDGHTVGSLEEVYHTEGELGIANAIARTTKHAEAISKINAYYLTQACLKQNQETFYADDDEIQIFMSACALRLDLATILVQAGYTLNSLIKRQQSEGTRAIRNELQLTVANPADIESIIGYIDSNDSSSYLTTVQDSQPTDLYSYPPTSQYQPSANTSEYSGDATNLKEHFDSYDNSSNTTPLPNTQLPFQAPAPVDSNGFPTGHDNIDRWLSDVTPSDIPPSVPPLSWGPPSPPLSVISSASQVRCKCGSTSHLKTSHHECPMRSPCKCGSTKHMRITHGDCPLNPKAAQTIQTLPAPVASPAPYGGPRPVCKCGSTTHIRTNHNDCPLNNKKNMTLVSAQPQPYQSPASSSVSSGTSGRCSCKCGSATHMRTNHSDCPLNKKNDVYVASTQPQKHQSSPSSSVSIGSSSSCKCGSTTHMRTNHSDCPLNKKNDVYVASAQPQQYHSPASSSVSTGTTSACKCGSTTHMRTNHSDCPLNANRNMPTIPQSVGQWQSPPSCVGSRGSTSRPACKCGSITHMRTNHSDCPLNTARNIPIQQSATQWQSPPSSAGSRFSSSRPACRCGSTTHMRTNHSECPLNTNRNMPIIQQSAAQWQAPPSSSISRASSSRPACRCGSTTHMRTNHSDCPLNSRRK